MVESHSSLGLRHDETVCDGPAIRAKIAILDGPGEISMSRLAGADDSVSVCFCDIQVSGEPHLPMT